MAERVIGQRPGVEVGGEVPDNGAKTTDTSVEKKREKSPPLGAEDKNESDHDENCDIGEDLTAECPICLQTCIHPVQLPCTHIFCFLCVKGVANQSKKCALCRSEIPVDYLNNPALVRKEDLLKENPFEDGYQWFYEGNRGWWQYDERASSEIEEHYKNNDRHFEILIAGFLYVIDLDNKHQYRRNDPTRRRKIKRDNINIPDKKGVAGLKYRPMGFAPQVRRDGDGGEIDNNNTLQQTTNITQSLPAQQQTVTSQQRVMRITRSARAVDSGTAADSQAISHQMPDVVASSGIPNTTTDQNYTVVRQPGRTSRVRPNRSGRESDDGRDGFSHRHQVQGGSDEGSQRHQISQSSHRTRGHRQSQPVQSPTDGLVPLMVPYYPQTTSPQRLPLHADSPAVLSLSSDSDSSPALPSPPAPSPGANSPEAVSPSSPQTPALYSPPPQHLLRYDMNSFTPQMAALNLGRGRGIQAVPRRRPRGAGRDANDNSGVATEDQTDDTDSDWE